MTSNNTDHSDDDETPDTKILDEEERKAIVARPIEKYLDHLEKMNRGVKYIQRMRRTLRDYEDWVNPQPEVLLGMSKSRFKDYQVHLRDEHGQNKRTQYGHLESVALFYNWLEKNEIVSSNPAYAAIEELREADKIRKDAPDRPTISLEEMAAFLAWLPTPWSRAIIMTHLKTGVRAGELINMDLCTVCIDHPCYNQLLDRYDIELVDKLAGYQDAIYVPSDIAVGDTVRGEVREVANKRKRDTIIPIDEELKSALLEYFLIRPYTPDHPAQAQPVFTMRVDTANDTPRCSAAGLNAGLISTTPGYVKQYGWWEPDTPTEEKVTQQYFRHYFSHHHKEGRGLYHDFLPKYAIKYIRGDVTDGADVLTDVYDHDDWDDWTRHIQEPYLASVYQFGVYK